MIRILDIALKDLMQLVRDFKTFMFLLIMPIVFTFLFGYAFGGFGSGTSDLRLPVGYLSQDKHWVTDSLHDLLARSEVIRLDENVFNSAADLEKLVADGDLAAVIVVPDGYGRSVLKGKHAHLAVITDTSTQPGQPLRRNFSHWRADWMERSAQLRLLSRPMLRESHSTTPSRKASRPGTNPRSPLRRRAVLPCNRAAMRVRRWHIQLPE